MPKAAAPIPSHTNRAASICTRAGDIPSPSQIQLTQGASRPSAFAASRAARHSAMAVIPARWTGPVPGPSLRRQAAASSSKSISPAGGTSNPKGFSVC